MSEIVRRGHPLNSVTPDLKSRIKRAQELTQEVRRIRQKASLDTSDPYQYAQEVYSRLDVTQEQVREADERDAAEKAGREAVLQPEPEKPTPA